MFTTAPVTQPVDITLTTFTFRTYEQPSQLQSSNASVSLFLLY